MGFDGARCGGKIEFLGLHFDALDLDAALDAVSARASVGLPFAYVVTPNVDHVVGFAREPPRAPLYERAWLTLNDSRVLAALARRAGLSLPVATGADLAEHLFEHVIDPNEPIVIIGGDERRVAALRRRYGLTAIRWVRVPANLKHDPVAIARAAAFAAAQQARFTFICVGAPQQELVAYAIAQRGDGVGVGLCCGAALDFLSGYTPRAPQWMRARGLEWLYRVAREPARLWRRYFVDGPKVFALFAAWRASMAA
ncbi:MAG: WecB/TagA/CpsF family glycosyltransferase [Terricaulis sp.]